MNFFGKISVWLGFFYLWFTGKTSKIIVKNSSEYDELKKNKRPMVYALWHGRLIFLFWVHKYEGICTLISKSKDGELIAKITEKLGYESIRGSTSKGGSEALLALINKAKTGSSVAFTPDGPRGPQRMVQPGVISVAQKSGLPIIPIAYASKRKYVVRHWDEFHIPYPFNKVSVCHGKPIYVNENDNLENKSKELKDAIDMITLQADSLI
ncbi:MAG: lysophospholipid acyltransferase family protein [Elusimicrobia bacterium]|nr:lysophospholipid acyltransferase family protein [Elusimicrobiota bacterium]